MATQAEPAGAFRASVRVRRVARPAGPSLKDDATRCGIQAYANETDLPGALIAVTASSNLSKSDRDPAEWRPPNQESWCVYATDCLQVNAKWQLLADCAEMSELRYKLDDAYRLYEAVVAEPTCQSSVA